MIISTAQSRKSKKWKREEISWQEMLERLKTPTRTQETEAEYRALPKTRRDEIKDVGGFVGGALIEGRRTVDSVQSRSLITLDLDHLAKGEDVWPAVEICFDFAACIYSTHSHTEDNPRVRLIIPTSRAMTADEYEPIARWVASEIDIDKCDDTTFEPNRLMYWPSCSRDAEYVFRKQDGPMLDPDEVLNSYDDWHDTSSWPVSSRKDKINAARAKRQGEPTEKPGVVGAFCQVYDVPEAIRTFLPDIYNPTSDPDRYSFTKGTTIGGLVLYQDGAFAYSHHATDPIEGRLVNSFDLVRLHLFGDKDYEAALSTPVNKLPSYKAMTDFALDDEQVSYKLAMNRIEGAFDEDFEDVPEEDDWRKRLKITAKGAIAATINNVAVILLHDEKLQNFFFDAFRERPIVCGDLPWIAEKERVTDNWVDTDDAGLRQYLEKHYQIDTPGKIRDAVDVAMLQRIRHPVREYLDSLEWDGVKRLDSLFIRYLGAEDVPYTRAVTRAALIGAVARIYKPGCKHDHMIVLIGEQGCGKSTTIGMLGKQWYSDSLFTMSGKDAYEQLQGYWIIELGEMAAMKKSEVEQVKQFVSKKTDNYRAAYAHRTQEHLRQCAFFGSTNDSDFLRDYTGGRRFWPVVVTGADERLTEEIVDQVWAEAVSAFRAGEKWYLTKDMEKEAHRIQKEHTEVNGRQGLIEAFLDKQIPDDWYYRTLDERRIFWDGDFEETPEYMLEPRLKVCALEIWCELFNGDPKMFTQSQAREINNMMRSIDGWSYRPKVYSGKIYGRQRGYVRDDAGLLE